jgi:predicted RNA-binding Zn-ribbon protein involved in translation (DUF1610 family)
MNGLETIRKMNTVKKGTVVEVSAHCVSFVCPRCGKYEVGEGMISHNKKGAAVVKCLSCGGGPYKARLSPL